MTEISPDFAQALEKLLNYAKEDGDSLSFTLAHESSEPIEIIFVEETTFEISESTLLIREYNEHKAGKSYYITYLIRLEQILYCQVI